MTATTSKLGADMLNDELKSNPLFEALKLAVGMLSLHGYEDEAKKVVAEARLARQPAAIDKEAVAKRDPGCANCGGKGHVPGDGYGRDDCPVCCPELDATPLATEASKPAVRNCQTGWADFCLMAKHDGVTCPRESCDIDDGIRAAPSVEQDERGAISEHDAKGLEIIASWMDRDGLIEPAEFLRNLAARAASTSANVAQLDMSLEARLTDAEADVKRLHAEKMELWNQVHGYSANVAQGDNAALIHAFDSALSGVPRYVIDRFGVEHVADKGGWIKESDLFDRFSASSSAKVAQEAEAVTEDISLVRELQKALFYWMPAIAGEDSPAGQKAAEHAYLLIGFDGNSLDCYGDQMRSSLGIVNRELERIGIACADAGCPDEMDVADFIGDLHARAQTAATVVLTDEQMMAAIKSVCGFDAEKAEQWRPEALTITPAMVKAAMPWLTGLHHMRTTDAKAHIKEAIKAALIAAQSASGDMK